MNETVPVLRPLRRDAELNRQRIMTAAREVFAARGLDATLDEVAHHAGLGVGTVYRRFPNRQALIDALFDEAFARIIALLDEAVAGPDPWEGFVAWLTEVVALQAGDRGLHEMMLHSGADHDRVDQLRERLKQPLELLVARAQQQGTLRGDISTADVAVLQLMAVSAADFTRSEDSEVWRRYLEILLDGLRVSRERPSALPVAAPAEDVIIKGMRRWPTVRRGSASRPADGAP